MQELEPNNLTVGALREAIHDLADDVEITFGENAEGAMRTRKTALSALLYLTETRARLSVYVHAFRVQSKCARP